MRKILVVLATSVMLTACDSQDSELEQLKDQVQGQQNLLHVLDISVQNHERHLKRLERQIDDAALGIPDLRTR